MNIPVFRKKLFHFEGVATGFLCGICGTVTNVNFTCGTGIVLGMVNTVFYTTGNAGFGFTTIHFKFPFPTLSFPKVNLILRKIGFIIHRKEKIR